MFKIAKSWALTLDACFVIITGYSLIDVLAFFLAFSIEELFDIKTIGSLIVTFTAAPYWIFRLLEWWVNKSNRKEYQRLKDENLRLDNEIKEQQLKKQKNDIIIQNMEKRKLEIELNQKNTG